MTTSIARSKKPSQMPIHESGPKQKYFEQQAKQAIKQFGKDWQSWIDQPKLTLKEFQKKFETSVGKLAEKRRGIAEKNKTQDAELFGERNIDQSPYTNLNDNYKKANQKAVSLIQGLLPKAQTSPSGEATFTDTKNKTVQYHIKILSAQERIALIDKVTQDLPRLKEEYTTLFPNNNTPQEFGSWFKTTHPDQYAEYTKVFNMNELFQECGVEVGRLGLQTLSENAIETNAVILTTSVTDPNKKETIPISQLVTWMYTEKSQNSTKILTSKQNPPTVRVVHLKQVQNDRMFQLVGSHFYSLIQTLQNKKSRADEKVAQAALTCFVLSTSHLWKRGSAAISEWISQVVVQHITKDKGQNLSSTKGMDLVGMTQTFAAYLKRFQKLIPAPQAESKSSS